MDSYPMTVDSVDRTHTPRPGTAPEDVQTSHDAGLFDEEDDHEDSAGNFVDALSQPSVCAVRPDKRVRDEVVSFDSTNQVQ
jgi:hypothetical protein